ncbi:MAG: pyridoxal-phosphate dependent enzyme, partial [Anaerolineae bacterium]|nr:pyridoxal-phosphate dependent enzyme [Anaerolineae bacterium]
KGFSEKVNIPAQNTLASAIQIGNPVSYEKAVKAIQETDGIVEQATEHELANAAALADKTGMYACPHTAVALAALFKLVNQGTIKSQDRVIVISTAHGLKFTNFKMKYHEDGLDEVEAQYANPPVNLPADATLVKEVLARRFDRE